jgi:hypothetical protein
MVECQDMVVRRDIRSLRYNDLLSLSLLSSVHPRFPFQLIIQHGLFSPNSASRRWLWRSHRRWLLLRFCKYNCPTAFNAYTDLTSGDDGHFAPTEQIYSLQHQHQ